MLRSALIHDLHTLLYLLFAFLQVCRTLGGGSDAAIHDASYIELKKSTPGLEACRHTDTSRNSLLSSEQRRIPDP